MSALTRVTVEESHKVYTEITFTCPLEIAELYKTLEKDFNRFVDIEEVNYGSSSLEEVYKQKEKGDYDQDCFIYDQHLSCFLLQ